VGCVRSLALAIVEEDSPLAVLRTGLSSRGEVYLDGIARVERVLVIEAFPFDCETFAHLQRVQKVAVLLYGLFDAGLVDVFHFFDVVKGTWFPVLDIPKVALVVQSGSLQLVHFIEGAFGLLGRRFVG